MWPVVLSDCIKEWGKPKFPKSSFTTSQSTLMFAIRQIELLLPERAFLYLKIKSVLHHDTFSSLPHPSALVTKGRTRTCLPSFAPSPQGVCKHRKNIGKLSRRFRRRQRHLEARRSGGRITLDPWMRYRRSAGTSG